MTAEIHIHGSYSILKGDYPQREVWKATSYPVEGASFSKAYKKGIWDGRKHLFNKTTGAFPTGLVSTVEEVLQGNKTPYTTTDHRTEPKVKKRGSFKLKGVDFKYPFDYQLDTCKKMVKAKQGIVKIATNGGKTEIACAVTKYLDIQTLFVVTTKELLYQARERFKTRLKYDDSQVGIVGDGTWSPGSKVTIALLDTLESRLAKPECQERSKQLINNTQLLFIDECHHVGSETWYTVSTLCPAFYRYGLSGTPLDRTDGANLRLIAATGDLIVDITNKFLVDRGISARANIIFDKVTSPSLPKRSAYNTVYKQGVVENDEVKDKVVEWTKICTEVGLSTLILVEEIRHGKILDDALWTETDGVFIPHVFINGTESADTRTGALADFGARSLPVLIASTILDEGVDVPTIDVLICAGSRKSRIRTMQRLGRGLRGKSLIVIEFSNFCHDYLLKHSLKRYQDYKQEECFPMYTSAPDKKLIEQLWKQQSNTS